MISAGYKSAYRQGYSDAMRDFRKKPKKGHWIRWYEQKENKWYIENIPHCKCSECGKEYDPYSSQFIKFCSNCGVRMESEVKDDCD